MRPTLGDDASWLVIADALVEQGNPLGEYIVLQLKKYPGETPKRVPARLRKLAREWRAAHAPWLKDASWGSNWGLRLTVANADELLAHADELRRLEMPLSIEAAGRSKYDRGDSCFFDAEFAHLARLRKEVTPSRSRGPPDAIRETRFVRTLRRSTSEITR